SLSLLTPVLASAETQTATPAAASPTRQILKQGVADQLKQQTAVQGGPLAGVTPSSISTKNIRLYHPPTALPRCIDCGVAVKFSARGLERPVSGPIASFERVKASGTYMTNSFHGPFVQIKKVTPMRAPI